MKTLYLFLACLLLCSCGCGSNRVPRPGERINPVDYCNVGVMDRGDDVTTYLVYNGHNNFKVTTNKGGIILNVSTASNIQN